MTVGALRFFVKDWKRPAFDEGPVSVSCLGRDPQSAWRTGFHIQFRRYSFVVGWLKS
jgi:hypothetical protein